LKEFPNIANRLRRAEARRKRFSLGFGRGGLKPAAIDFLALGMPGESRRDDMIGRGGLKPAAIDFLALGMPGEPRRDGMIRRGGLKPAAIDFFGSL